MTRLLFMAVVTLLPLSQAQTSECNYNTSQSMSDGGMSSNDLRADATRGLALVLSNYTFSCDGILQQWSIHWEIKNPDRCEIIVDFHVLRPTKTPGFCGLLSVGMHREVLIPTQTPRPYRTVDSFKTNSSVRVEAGDVVGLVVMFNNSRRCRLGGVSILKAREPSDPGLVYLARPASQEELTTDEWRLETLTGFGCDDCSSDGRTHSRTRTRTTDSDREERLPPGTRTRPSTSSEEGRLTSPRTGTPRPRPSTSSEEGRPTSPRTGIYTNTLHITSF
ncbi:hypothetical protein GBAR_LOCUS19912 [Geodia barretti]|uniref:Uncharacterized protein n=1 Tax=Geodia barretti TaxID=519541 RepID=A0AA35SSS5_GEOBA|nr:hypothetical protein GBAR_LOCUS19912 [Geodia barretti]